jgi:hypothetical protein
MTRIYGNAAISFQLPVCPLSLCTFFRAYCILPTSTLWTLSSALSALSCMPEAKLWMISLIFSAFQSLHQAANGVRSIICPVFPCHHAISIEKAIPASMNLEKKRKMKNSTRKCYVFRYELSAMNYELNHG